MTNAFESPERREPARPSRILKVGAALVALLVAASLLLLDPLPEVSAGDELASHFAVSELPFGFRVEGARRLMTQELVVTLDSDDSRRSATPDIEVTASDSEGEAESTEAADGEAEDPTVDEDRERHAQADGTPPSSVYLVRYPRRSAQRVLARQMARHTLSMEGPGGGRDGDTDEELAEELLTIEGGRLPWGDYDADFVLERKYTSDGHFEDVLRVNLTRGQQCWVLFAVWPRGYRGSRDPVEALLDALQPV